MSFWDKVYVETAPQPVQQPGRAWWQEPQSPPEYGGLQQQSTMPHPIQSVESRVRELKKIRADEMSAEDMEFLAEYELNNPKYNAMCPQCGSANYVPAGTKLAGVVMSTEKCFDCGLSARGPEPSLGGRGKGASIATRQIDTGGAGGVGTYMAFRGVPSGYLPRG